MNEQPALSERQFTEQNYWGLIASVDLYGCNPKMISNPDDIRAFVKALCQEIKMTRHGETLIDRFGDGTLEGYSFMQFIETSSITAHFDETENRAFIDVFSCKYFDPQITADFCRKFFKAGSFRINVLPRK